MLSIPPIITTRNQKKDWDNDPNASSPQFYNSMNFHQNSSTIIDSNDNDMERDTNSQRKFGILTAIDQDSLAGSSIKRQDIDNAQGRTTWLEKSQIQFSSKNQALYNQTLIYKPSNHKQLLNKSNSNSPMKHRKIKWQEPNSAAVASPPRSRLDLKNYTLKDQR